MTNVRRRDRGTGGNRRTESSPTSQEILLSQSVREWNEPQPGNCKNNICGEEAACKNFSNGTYICLCPHDSSPPTADLRCPNRSTVPLTPRPIHNIIPPSGGNSTTPRSIQPTNINGTTKTINRIEFFNGIPNVVTIVAPFIIIFILIIIFTSCWKWKRNKRTREAEAPHTGEPLLAERYIANPQYSTAYGTPDPSEEPGVPLLVKETLTFIEEIGEGCFGKVYKGELKLNADTTILVAIKLLKVNASRSAENDFMREVSVMSSFSHENILTLIGVIKGENDLNPLMVFEFMPFGDLAGVLRSNSPTIHQTIPGLQSLDSRCLLYIALQIARGMQYLAFQRFVHRDLACRNCLVGKDLVVKIADFGMSRDVYTSDYYKMNTNKPMPIRWMSPESIVYARFTLESDVWSYGVVLWEIYSLGKQPFYGHNNDGASKLILEGIMLIPPDNCPEFICELMRACWRSDPKDRIKFPEICQTLQQVYDDGNWEDSGDKDNESRNNENDSWIMAYDNKERWSVESANRLPLPPTEIRQPMTAELLDPEGYLLPSFPGNQEYLTALPD